MFAVIDLYLLLICANESIARAIRRGALALLLILGCRARMEGCISGRCRCACESSVGEFKMRLVTVIH